jgi:hypothetical protein
MIAVPDDSHIRRAEQHLRSVGSTCGKFVNVKSKARNGKTMSMRGMNSHLARSATAEPEGVPSWRRRSQLAGRSARK